ncbi:MULTISPECIES: hypothetical protein [unclassified Planococcus (in: firmicutes)]|uniref:hypothetical protein n=1 Tax=unclassified Planococcus (in: firmicutes) TaxID=2662419 RepID=UPI000C7D8158|nr:MULTISPECIES: hypothetical protein [unclassified Planococcus (in: firmicutes)]PKG48898.1 hypothetical protein CXF66_00190 [Planococcus sp. Urea-trap-24]PKG89680.1 hypothetical protein CXF91_05715 [Planococcus sp. Urea-3u-39]
MYIRISEDVVIEDLGNEKLLIEMSSQEGHVIDNEAYILIKPAEKEYIHVNSLYSEVYDFDEYINFINELISKKVLVCREHKKLKE